MELLKALKDLITKAEEPTASITYKKVDVEERRVIGVVLEPEVEDLHNDIYSAEEICKACDNFNEVSQTANVQHSIDVTTETATIEKSFILPVDANIGDQFVKEGSWIQQWKIHDDLLWDAVKAGTFTGFSIGAKAFFEDVE